MQNIVIRDKLLYDIRQALKANQDCLLEYPVEKPKPFAEYTRAVLREHGLPKSRIKIRAASDRVYVIVHEPSYVEKLEAMIRKLAMHVDDEKLYEQAQELLGTI